MGVDRALPVRQGGARLPELRRRSARPAQGYPAQHPGRDRAVYDEERNLWRVHLRPSGDVAHARKYLHLAGWACSPSPSGRTSPASTRFTGHARACRTLAARGHRPHAASGWASSGSAPRASRSSPRSPPRSAELVVFQRTPNFIVETNNDKVTPEQLAHVRATYDEIWERAAAHPFGVDMVPAPAQRSGCRPRSSGGRSSKASGTRADSTSPTSASTTSRPTTSRANWHPSSSAARSERSSRIPQPQSCCRPKTYSFNGKRVPTGFGFYDSLQPSACHARRRRHDSHHRDHGEGRAGRRNRVRARRAHLRHRVRRDDRNAHEHRHRRAGRPGTAGQVERWDPQQPGHLDERLPEPSPVSRPADPVLEPPRPDSARSAVDGTCHRLGGDERHRATSRPRPSPRSGGPKRSTARARRRSCIQKARKPMRGSSARTCPGSRTSFRSTWAAGRCTRPSVAKPKRPATRSFL